MDEQDALFSWNARQRHRPILMLALLAVAASFVERIIAIKGEGALAVQLHARGRTKQMPGFSTGGFCAPARSRCGFSNTARVQAGRAFVGETIEKSEVTGVQR